MFLLHLWALKVAMTLLSMEGQKALRFHKKYLYLYSEGEQRSYLLIEFLFLGELAL